MFTDFLSDITESGVRQTASSEETWRWSRCSGKDQFSMPTKRVLFLMEKSGPIKM